VGESENLSAQMRVLRQIGRRLTGAASRGWLLAAALLGLGALPCPECGAPMVFHFWPVAAIVLFAQALKRRYRKMSEAQIGGANQDAAPVDHRRE
jgi:hypothetical protein